MTRILFLSRCIRRHSAGCDTGTTLSETRRALNDLVGDLASLSPKGGGFTADRFKAAWRRNKRVRNEYDPRRTSGARRRRIGGYSGDRTAALRRIGACGSGRSCRLRSRRMPLYGVPDARGKRIQKDCILDVFAATLRILGLGQIN
jgi:hypothetical protein